MREVLREYHPDNITLGRIEDSSESEITIFSAQIDPYKGARLISEAGKLALEGVGDLSILKIEIAPEYQTPLMKLNSFGLVSEPDEISRQIIGDKPLDLKEQIASKLYPISSNIKRKVQAKRDILAGGEMYQKLSDLFTTKGLEFESIFSCYLSLNGYWDPEIFDPGLDVDTFLEKGFTILSTDRQIQARLAEEIEEAYIQLEADQNDPNLSPTLRDEVNELNEIDLNRLLKLSNLQARLLRREFQLY